jgi:phospholipid transport system substrate-binding protein
MRMSPISSRTVAGLALAGLLAWSLPASAAETSPQDARHFMQDITDRTVTVLRNAKTADAAKTRAAFEAILRDGLDLNIIGRFVLGNAWRTASERQQATFIELFTVYVLDSYSRRLGGSYSGETIKLTGAGPIAGTDAIINSEIDRTDGQPPVKVDWRVRDVDGHMKIIDVVVEGLSMALTQRQEFASVMQHGGLDGLIGELRQRVQKLQSANN